MTNRIDVEKLKGVYYNNADISCYISSLSDIKQTLATDTDMLCDNNTETSFNDVEDMIVEYIKNLPVSEYNNILDKNSKIMTVLEAYANLLLVISKFSQITTLSTIILIFCDYFSLEYENIICELPNGLKIKLYYELKAHIHKTDILDNLCGINKNDASKPLF